MAKNTITLKNPDGAIVFMKEDFEYPDSWSLQAATTFARYYTLTTEHSVDQALDRILSHFSECHNKAVIKQAILDQKASFNSPVMFNFGTCEKPLGSACFILNVQDDMDDIGELYKKFMSIYKYGAGAGINPSSLRASMEKLSRSDGVASGPLSFMEVADCIAKVVRSGGRQRRAAKGIWLDCDHPDVEMFIDAKWKEEEKARVLETAGYGSGMESESYNTVAFQNVNMSVRLTDAFMKAVEEDGEWNLTARKDGAVVKTVRARELMMKIAEAAHKCGDPGVQFHDTINRANPFAILGNDYIFNASNPCAEFMFLDNSACNLASINLNKFYDGNTFDIAGFTSLCKELIFAMDRIIDIALYPTEEITANSVKFRPLGLGYTGLGTVLMRMGLPYGSPGALEFVEFVTREMTRAAWETSHELYNLFDANLSKEEQDALTDHVRGILHDSQIYGFRNSQVTLLAPTGTISFIMDTGDSTGIEPVVAIEASKTVIGGQVIKVLAKGAEEALKKTGAENFDHPVFATSIGKNCVSVDAHLATMEAAQKFVSGSISKTINLPSETTPQQIFDLYVDAWKRGIKAVAVYRAGSKINEPLKVKSDPQKEPSRTRLPRTRTSRTHHFEVMGVDGYLTIGYYDDGRIGEVFCSMQKTGSTVQGLLNSFSIMMSNALQYGVPIEDIIRKFKGTMFDPAGITDNPDIPICSSILDYVVRYIETTLGKPIEESEVKPSVITTADDDIRTCPECGNVMTRKGRCHICNTCGASGGCS